MKNDLSQRQLKILAGVSQAQEAGYYLSEDGVLAFLHGELSEDWAKACPQFGSLVSLGNRQGKTAIRVCLHHDYLGRKYDRDSDEYFYYLTEKGKAVLILHPLRRSGKAASGKRPPKPLFKTKESL